MCQIVNKILICKIKLNMSFKNCLKVKSNKTSFKRAYRTTIVKKISDEKFEKFKSIPSTIRLKFQKKSGHMVVNNF